MKAATRFVLGKLEFTYENGFIRYIKAGGAELVRMIYFALRDRQWQTIPFEITNEQITRANGKSLQITYHATNKWNGTDIIRWLVNITATAEEITFSVEGEVLNSFVRNRVGICVLHPIEETIGRTATIIQPDGTTTTAGFPIDIKPHQPFLEIRELKWTLANGVEGHLKFNGDIFETEDQRNWSDASFKTYSTPLRIPFPVEIRKGDCINQQVTLRVHHLEKVSEPDPVTEHVDVSVDFNKATPFPELGTLFALHQPRPTEAEAASIRQLPLQHLRIDLHLSDPSWPDTLRAGWQDCQAFALSPAIAFHFSNNIQQELIQVETTFATFDLKQVRALWIFGEDHFVTSDKLLTTTSVKIRSMFPGAMIYGGSASHFVELNRYPFDFRLVDGVSYSVTPQAHANDDRTIIENLGAQPHAVRSARKLAVEKRVSVSPVILRGGQSEPDLRQAALFAAGWTIGSVKYLGEEGVSAITFFESHGAKGFVNDEGRFPVFDALRRIGSFQPESILRSACSDPLRLSSLVLRRGNQILTVLANHTAEVTYCRMNDVSHQLAGYGIIYIES